MRYRSRSWTAALRKARRQGARAIRGMRGVRAPVIRAMGPVLFVAALLCFAVPSFGGKRKAFGISDTAWDLDTKATAVAVVPGRGTVRRRIASPALSIAFHADGTLTLSVDEEPYGGTWSQRGKKIGIEFDPLIGETFNAICDSGLGDDCSTSVRAKASASSRKGKVRLKLKLVYRLKLRASGERVRRTDIFNGKSERELVR
jgi:hypothetical protein